MNDLFSGLAGVALMIVMGAVYLILSALPIAAAIMLVLWLLK